MKRYTELLGFYTRASGIVSNNSLLDMPISIGNENGVRGDPLQYQHGNHLLTGSIEARLCTDYNILKIFELGFIALSFLLIVWGEAITRYFD